MGVWALQRVWMVCVCVCAASKSNFTKSAIVMSPAKQLTCLPAYQPASCFPISTSRRQAFSHVKYLYCIAIPRPISIYIRDASKAHYRNRTDWDIGNKSNLR